MGAARFRVLLFSIFFFERTRTVASMKAPCLIYLSTRNEVMLVEQSDRCHFSIRHDSPFTMTPFLHIGKKSSSYRGACRVPLFKYSVCPSVCVCVTFVVFTYCHSCTRLTYGSEPVWANASDVFSRTWSRGGHGRCADVHFVVCFWCVGLRAFFIFRSSNAHGLLQV